MDKISVIVPVYNVERYLDRCIQSIINQNYKNIEIILIDDESTDSSGVICDGYKDSRIKVFHKKNEGLGLSRNYGINISTGKYILFVDSDDYIDKDMLDNLYKDMIANNSDTVIGGFKRVYSEKKEKYINPYAGNLFKDDMVVHNVLEKMFGKKGKYDDHIEMSVWKTLFSSDIIKKNKLAFPSEREFISEDIIFDIDYFSKAKSVYMSDDIGYNYCDNMGSLTTKYNPNRYSLQKKLLVELERKTKQLGIYKNVEQRLLNTFIANTRYTIKMEQKFFLNGMNNSAKENIKYICNDNFLQEKFKIYTVKESFKSELVNLCIRRKKIWFICITMYIKNVFDI